MGRELKRVPLDFDYPMGKVWYGYCPTIEIFQKLYGKKYPFLYEYKDCCEICHGCNLNAGECEYDADYCFWYNKDNKNKWFKEVPDGEGYQLWENTSEGSPYSPVFKTLDELCEWCENNTTVFASEKISKEQWKRILDNDAVNT